MRVGSRRGTNRATDSLRSIYHISSTWFPSKGVDFEDIRFDNVVSHTDMSFLRIHRLKARDTTVRNLHFSNICGTQLQPSYIWSRPGKPFENITFANVDMDKGIECVNVSGLRFTGGTFEEIKLPPEELKQRNDDIETSHFFSPSPSLTSPSHLNHRMLAKKQASKEW